MAFESGASIGPSLTPTSLGVGKAGGTAEPTKDFAKIAGAAKVVTDCANTAAEVVAQLADYWRPRRVATGTPNTRWKSAILRGHWV